VIHRNHLHGNHPKITLGLIGAGIQASRNPAMREFMLALA
jgi:hypothetical protein